MQLVFIAACVAYIVWLIKRDYKVEAEETAKLVTSHSYNTVMLSVMKEILTEIQLEKRNNGTPLSSRTLPRS
jgi:hypothetical protein